MLAYILALAVGLGSLAMYMAAFFFPEVHRKNDFIWSGVGLFYALVLWVCARSITGALLLGQIAGVALLGWSVTQTLQLRRELTPPKQQTEVPSAEQVAATVQGKVSKLSLSQRLGDLSKRVGGSATAAKSKIQQTMSKPTQKPKTQEVASTQAPAPTLITTPDAATEEAIAPPSALANENIEVIDNRTWTPEVTPLPTESPLGQNPPPPQVEMEAVPAETAQTELAPPTDSSPEGDVTEPIHPHPPSPELVEAAIEDAEAKHIPSSPPQTSED